MAGKLNGEPTKENDETYENNLRFAVGLLETENILGLIEPINSYSVPNYYLNSYEKGKFIMIVSYYYSYVSFGISF